MLCQEASSGPSARTAVAHAGEQTNTGSGGKVYSPSAGVASHSTAAVSVDLMGASHQQQSKRGYQPPICWWWPNTSVNYVDLLSGAGCAAAHSLAAIWHARR